jgi:rare lipoprotein A
MSTSSRSGIPLLAALGLAVAACAQSDGGAGERRAEARPRPAGRAEAPPQRGEASYYASRFHGQQMANGERFDAGSDSAAHRSLPFGTRAEVTNLETGRTETVTIEDRGPFVRGRIIDVSPATAERLGMKEDGTAPVVVRPVEVPGGGRRDARR